MAIAEIVSIQVKYHIAFLVESRIQKSAPALLPVEDRRGADAPAAARMLEGAFDSRRAIQHKVHAE